MRQGLLGRREFLDLTRTGLASTAFLSLAGARETRPGGPYRPEIYPEAPNAPRPSPEKGRAQQVLLIFCSGAVSHVDTFDYKPQLIKYNGKPLPGGEKLVTFQGEQGNLTAPLWKFRPRGQSGKMMSDLLPHIGDLADELCFIHSMTAKSNTHGPAENQMSTGFTLDGFPSAGAWISYALGSECASLPAFVAIPDPRGVPQMGPNNWSSGFLPAVFQGTAFNASEPIPHLKPPGSISPATDRSTRDFLKFLNEKHRETRPHDTELAARIASHELAARMQLEASEAADLSRENQRLLDDYGANDPDASISGFARNCILARRLLERGVRFVELFNGSYAMGEGVGNWDGHKTIHSQYSIHSRILDRACAQLIRDLKSRGMLERTLVVWVTEFGRMPTFQKGANGRDHNPKGFTVWMTGAGVKKGFSHGATDDFGHQAVENVRTIYDLHATVLHLLGIDHERLSWYHNGIERRLTDVHGEPIREILA